MRTVDGIPGKELTDYFKTPEEGRRYRVVIAGQLSAIDQEMAALDKNWLRTPRERLRHAELNDQRNSRLIQLHAIDLRLRSITPFAKWNQEEWLRTNESVLTVFAGFGAAASMRARPAVQSKATVSPQRGGAANAEPAMTPSQLRSAQVAANETGQKPILISPRKVDVNEKSIKISSNPSTGNPAAIARGFGTLNSRQKAVLDKLPTYGSSTITEKSFGQKDLSALTAVTGDEFAMFSTGGRRLIYRGNAGSVPITPDIAKDLVAKGWKWSSHVHPGDDTGVLRSSEGDQAVLTAMNGNQSAIYNSSGQRSIFTPAGDSLKGWMPW